MILHQLNNKYNDSSRHNCVGYVNEGQENNTVIYNSQHSSVFSLFWRRRASSQQQQQQQEAQT